MPSSSVATFLDKSVNKIGPTKWYSALHYYRFLFIINYLLKRKINKNKKETVLEIGVWPGYLAFALSLAGMEVSGIDMKPERINLTDYFKDFWQYDLNSNPLIFPCKDNYCNYVVASEVIEHLNPKNSSSFFSEIERILKPDGLLILTTPNRNSLHNKLRRSNMIEKAKDGHGHVYEYVEKELNKIISQSRIKILSSETINFYANVGSLAKNEYFYPLTSFRHYPNKLFNILKLLALPAKQIPPLKDSLIIIAQK
ncbi:MAG: class I SAM-dependent methyltransferase [Candidatus Moranbacteria bacterium]|nr:class I SAM-dependent methyltransferase [Candidatus Moranbacteria bacterium]